ncbi:MAG TPA: extracellular solute-binding protein, partial [Roseiflexaceae bacterium]|nr:extracellular solute-binding protein [Roseiflexaceae bacterium]
MKQKWLARALLLLIVGFLFLAGCGGLPGRRSGEALSGRILLWHAWGPQEADALNQVVNSFVEVHPAVTVKVQAFAGSAPLLEQFLNSSDSGLQADLLLGPAGWLTDLRTARAVSPLDESLSQEIIARYAPAILAALQVDGLTFGLPEALDTMAIYVNRRQVDTPATSLAGIQDLADTGVNILIPTNFYDAFWGIQAFGGRLFDEEQRAVLDRGGFANWLAWLRDARNAPGMILESNRE